MAQRYRQFELTIVNEFGEPVTNIDQIEIFDAGTSDDATIYADRAGTLSMTNPITTSSTNSTFVQSLGYVRWFQAAATYKVTITESGASQSFTSDNRDSTDSRFAWFADYIGEAATLQTSDTADLDIGTDDDFVHDWDNANSIYIIYPSADGGRLDFGKSAVHTDIYMHAGDTTTDYVFFDEGSLALNMVDIDLQLDDEAKLTFGDSQDVTFEYDESGNDLDITSTTALDEISFGATGDGYDLKWWSTTSGDYVLFDYSADAVLFEDVELFLGDGEGLYFGDTVGTGDFKISDESDVLTIAQVVADTGEVAFGASGTDVPTKWHAETAGDFLYITGDDVQLEDVSLCLADSTQLQFGDPLGTGDIKVYASGTDLIIDGVVADTGTVAVGVTDHGLDFKLWAATDADGILWDASDEDLEFVGVNLVLDGDSAIENPDVVITDAAAYDITAANSGKIHILTNLSQNTSIDLPAEADGLNYEIWYCGATETHDHTIDSESDTNYFIGGVGHNDTDGETSASVTSDGDSNSKLTINNAETGTFIKLTCDGTNWYVTGMVFSDTAPAFADQ
jgi:hypothetical protein